MSTSTPTSQSPPAGWYPDPEGAELRWWDGRQWTDHRHAATANQASAPADASTASQRDWHDLQISLPVALALLGGALAIVGVFLPAVDAESSFHIAKNSLVQHPEGLIVLCVVLLGVLAALRGGGSVQVIAGIGLVGLAAYSGLHASDLVRPNAAGEEFLNQTAGTVLGERVAEAFSASPGPGIWAIGIAGACLILSVVLQNESRHREG
jgi:hypothetical protein